MRNFMRSFVVILFLMTVCVVFLSCDRTTKQTSGPITETDVPKQGPGIEFKIKTDGGKIEVNTE